MEGVEGYSKRIVFLRAGNLIIKNVPKANVPSTGCKINARESFDYSDPNGNVEERNKKRCIRNC